MIPPLHFDRQAKAAVIVCVTLLVVCGAGFEAAVHSWSVYLQKLPVELRDSLSTLPRQFGAWEAVSQDEVLTEEIVEALGTDKYLSRRYERQDPRTGEKVRMDLHVAYYTGMIDAVPHVPDRCLEAGGWDPLSPTPTNLALRVNQSQWGLDAEAIHGKRGEPYPTALSQRYLTGQPMTVRMPLGELQLRTTEFALRANPNIHIFAGYLFIANGQTTPSPYDVQWLAFGKDDKYAYYCKVQFGMYVESSKVDADVFVDRVSELLGALLPEVMRCLPDWAEVEQRSAETSGV